MSSHPLQEVEDYTLNKEWPLSKEQQDGVRFCMGRARGILNFQTGLGKTYLALTAAATIMNYKSAFRTVILCPAEANDIFVREITTKLKESYCLHQSSGVSGEEDSRFHIFNFTSLIVRSRGNGEESEGKVSPQVEYISKMSRESKLVAIIDEAHAIQHRDTKQYKAFLSVRPYFSVIYAMTATPLMALHNMRGLFNLLNFLFPERFPYWSRFRDTYLSYKMEKLRLKGGREIPQEVILAVKDVPGLRAVLDKHIIVRAINYDIRYHYHEVELTEEEARFYRQAGKGLLEGKERDDFASRLHDLQQIVDWSHESVPDELRRKLSGKDKLLVSLLRDISSKGLSAIVYTEYHSTLNRIAGIIEACRERGILKDVTHVFRITGKESRDERSRVETDLSPGSVVLCTRAGSQSRNLQRANQVLVFNIPFSIGVLIQLVGRVARMDSRFDHQDVHILEAKGTIDTYKRMYAQDNAWVYSALFGENANLPDIEQIDRRALKLLRRKLLWSFKH